MFRVIPEGAAFREHVLLRDGQGVLVRAGARDDVGLVEEFIGRVSPESLRLRFGATVRGVPRDLLEDLSCGNFEERGCLLALAGEGAESRVVGVGNYIGLGSRRSAEIAILVEDAYHGQGISTLLLERLAGLAAANDYVEFVAEVLEENQAMLDVLASVGFEVHQVREAGTVHVVIPVGSAAAIRERAQLRERIAVANSLAPLLRPRAVAVLGASRDPSAVGSMIFANVLAGDFAGTVYPVNPRARTVLGVRAYGEVSEIPETPDLAVVAVPSGEVFEVVERAAHHGVKGVIVVTTGFAEEGPEGAERQRRLTEMVRAHGLRLIGPCSLGILNTSPGVSLNASLAPALPRRGTLGFFSHSASLGLAVLESAADRGVGFSSFVSAGNRADVHADDLLLYWEEDPDTTMVALYLESFGDPRRFARIARRMTPHKPILCVKSARSLAGRAAAEAHCGVPISSTLEGDSLFHQAGVIRVDSLEQLFDVAALLANQPLPVGNRVALVSNSGGLTTLSADACEANGLELVESSSRIVGALATPEQVRDALDAALAAADVDALFAAFACIGDWNPRDLADEVRRRVRKAAGAGGAGRPAVLTLVGATGSLGRLVEEGIVRELPVYRLPEAAARALGHAVRYAEHRRRPPGKVRWHEDVDAAAARHLVHEMLAESLTPGPDRSTALLAEFGIAVTGREGTGVRLCVRPDPLFGPLIELRAGDRPSLLRITPLTDSDIAKMVEDCGLGDLPGLPALLSRLTQLIEELPWVSSLDGVVAAGEAPAFTGPVRIVLTR